MTFVGQPAQMNVILNIDIFNISNKQGQKPSIIYTLNTLNITALCKSGQGTVGRMSGG